MILGLGTAAIGRPEYINIRQEEKEEFLLDRFRKAGLEILNEAYARGVRYYDTAPGYGLAEELLIEWAHGKKEVELATKWGYTYVADFNPDAKQHEIKEHSLSKLKSQWAVSKEALPLLSTYQIHSATLETGVLENEEVLLFLHNIKKTHGIKIGLTTTGENQEEVLKKALKVEVEGEELFSVFQVTFNVLEQSLYDILLALSKTDKRVVIKEAMANGRLLVSEKFNHYAGLREALEKIAQMHEVTLDAVALRYAYDTVKPFCVLSGASTTEHVASNLQATNFTLNKEDKEILARFSISPKEYWQERKNLVWQ